MITKRDILIELLWLVVVLVISLITVYLFKESSSLVESGDVGFHDVYLVLDYSYAGLLSIIYVPIAYIILSVKGLFTREKRLISIINILILNLLFIAFNSHFIAYLLQLISVSYFSKESGGWTIHPPLRDSEVIGDSVVDTYFDSDSIGFWYTIVLFILCLSLIYFSYQLALKVKRLK